MKLHLAHSEGRPDTPAAFFSRSLATVAKNWDKNQASSDHKKTRATFGSG